MNCQEVRSRLLAGQSAEDPDVSAHASGCEACRELLADDARLGRELAALTRATEREAPAFADLQSALGRERGVRAWLRSRPTPKRLLLAGLAAMLVTALGLLRPRADLPRVDGWALLSFVVALLLAVVAAARGALRLGRGPLQGAWIVLALLLPFGVTWAASEGLTEGAAHAWSTGAPVRSALSCFGYGLVLAAPLLVLLFALHRSDSFDAAGAALVAAATGLAANAALLLHCGSSDPLHLWAGHAGIGAALAGAWLGVSRLRRA